MERIWLALFYVLTMAEYISFFYIVLGRHPQKARRRDAIGYIIIVCLMIVGIWKTAWGIDMFPLYLLSIWLMYLVFHLSIRETFGYWFLSFFALVIIENLFDYVLIVLGIHMEIMRGSLYLVGVLITLWIYYFFIGRKIDREAFRLPVKIWGIVVGIMALLVALMSYFTFVLDTVSQKKAKNMGVILIVVGSIAIFCLIFGMIYYFNNTQKSKQQTELLEAQNEQQREYFQQLLQREQETRQFRHDMINDLIALQNFCEKEEYNRVKGYLGEMLGNLTEIRGRQYDVGNDMVNTIINYYFRQAPSECQVVVKGYMGEELTISQRDLCVIVSNLVKNSIEAVTRGNRVLHESDTQKRICFEVNQGKQYLTIHVENTIEEELNFSRNGLPETTKADKRNHGLGLRNVKAVVEKYKGTYRCIVENKCFLTEISLKI